MLSELSSKKKHGNLHVLFQEMVENLEFFHGCIKIPINSLTIVCNSGHHMDKSTGYIFIYVTMPCFQCHGVRISFR